MASRRRKKITPKLPLRDKPVSTPKFLKVFKVPRSRTPTGPKTKVPLPSASDKVPHLPKLLHGSPSSPFIGFPIDMPRRRSKFNKYPRIIRIAKSIKSLLKVEPDKPVRMPKFPTLAFPRLYTRFAIMKTYTAVTDVDGKITVTFPRLFRKIPGVVISPQDAGTWFEHVLSKNEFGFTVQILKTAHAHQHANSGGNGGHSHGGFSGFGGTHSHNIISNGAHWHTVGGTVDIHLYLDTALVDVGIGLAGTHSHTNPATSWPTGTLDAVDELYPGSTCDVGSCISSYSKMGYATETHTHSQGNTGSAGLHNHGRTAYVDYFIYDLDASVSAWTTSTHGGHDHPEDDAGYHDHVLAFESNHAHSVPDSNEKEASLLANTSVTFTYFAQEET